MSFKRLFCLALVLLLTGTSKIVHAQADNAVDSVWRTDGRVNSTLVHGNTLYVGGAFEHFGPDNGGGAPADAASGNLLSGFPEVKGIVNKAVTDGHGGWIIGGNFTRVGDSLRNNLAHIHSDLSVSAWNPRINGIVTGLILVEDSVIVSGTFTHIGSDSGFLNIAKICLSTGQPSINWKARLSGPVEEFQIYGDTLFMTYGENTYVNGNFSKYLGAVHYSTGAYIPYNFDPNGSVNAILIKNDILYIGGDFYFIAGDYRSNVAGYNLKKNLLTPLNLNIGGGSENNVVNGLATSGDTLFACGYMHFVDGIEWGVCMVAINMGTSSWISDWKPIIGGGVTLKEIVTDNNYIYAAAMEVFRIRKSDGKWEYWSVSVNARVNTLAFSGPNLYLGGKFNSIGSYKHYNFAAVDLITGKVKDDFNPRMNGPVSLIKMVSGRLFIEGKFSAVNDSRRVYVAALDPKTGEVLSWNVESEVINTMATDGNVIYVGGRFSYINGEGRKNLAALDPITAKVLPLNADFNSAINDLQVAGSKLFISGYFNKVNDQDRSNMASIDLKTGKLNSWNPNLTPTASLPEFKMWLVDSQLHIRGPFSTLGGTTVDGSGSVDTSAGMATSWQPDIGLQPNSIRDICPSENGYYVVGDFTKVNGSERFGVAEVNRTGSTTLPSVFYMPEDRPNVAYYQNGSLFVGTAFGIDLFGRGSVFKFNIPQKKPTVASSSLKISSITACTMNLNWSKGRGAMRLVIAREETPVSDLPVDRTGYEADSFFGLGSPIGGGFVVYNGPDSFMKIYDLKPGTRYHFAVIEYNGIGTNAQYLTDTILIGTAVTLSCSDTLEAAAKDTSTCVGTAFTVNLDKPSVGFSYHWYNTETGRKPFFSGTNFTTPVLNEDINYWVALYDTVTLCESQRAKVGVKVLIPVKPRLILKQNVLSTTVKGKAYQWYDYLGYPIKGADSSAYLVLKSYSYYVKVTDENGCDALSDTMKVTYSGIDAVVQSSEFKVYPNPAADVLNISAPGEYTVEFCDILSRTLVRTRTSETRETAINLSGYKPGLYFLRFFNSTGSYELKVLKR